MFPTTVSILIFTSLHTSHGGQGNNKYYDCDYVLYNKNFYDGTYRITKSGKYCIGENISLNPRSGTADNPNRIGAWFPTNAELYPGSTTHSNGGWALGFFSAISIETSDVTLDLFGHEIEMSRPFYLQQRWFNIIEIQNAAFNVNEGPADFGQTIKKIQNVRIRNGKLGRSSHNGIHAFDVENVHVSDLQIYAFEVAGVQFNGFKTVYVSNLDIGPSSTQVPFWGYYSHARFSLNGFELIQDRDKKYVKFKGEREMTVQQIYDRLRMALDIAYRHSMGLTTENDRRSELFDIAIRMFANPWSVPDGSVIYGMIFNSKGLAVQGFGDSPNDEDSHGNELHITNVKIHHLRLNINEIPGLYLDRCEGHYFNEVGTQSITPILGRFGDLFDLRRTLSHKYWKYIDGGFFAYDKLRYRGNPLSDAQVALNIFSDAFVTNWGIHSTEDPNRGMETFLRWATHNGDRSYDSLPNCARFVCNGDAMFHVNKGLIGVRMDGIENVAIKDLYISALYNESPLASLACGDYDGPNNGGQPNQLHYEGFMGTDIRGVSIINGGSVELYGEIVLKDFVSSNGDVIGIHLMDDVSLWFDNPEHCAIEDLVCGATVTEEEYVAFQSNAVNPWPNNFYVCNIRAEKLKLRTGFADTSDGSDGFIYPMGVIPAHCQEMYYENGVRRLVNV